MPGPFPRLSDDSARQIRQIGLQISIAYFLALLVVLTGLAVIDGWETLPTFAARCFNHAIAIGMTVLLGRAITRSRQGSFALKACFVVVVTLGVAAIYFLISFYVFRLMGMNESEMTLGDSLRMILYWFAQFLGWSALVLALLYHFEVQDRERQLSSLRELAYSAQMRALRYQINPHFLFNTLNALAALIEEREHATAERMVLSLSSFLRSTLALDPMQDITLAQELAIQARYLDIERERFSDRLQVSFDMPDRLASASLPSLILQPLVENAVKHGIGAVDGPIIVRLRAEACDGTLLVHVENTTTDPPIARAGEGVGLRNVAERLQARFGEAAQLTSGLDAGLFRATVRLPLRVAPA